MPCYDPRDNMSNPDNLVQKEELEAALCAITKVFPAHLYEQVDWIKAGITPRQLAGWMKKHHEKDMKR